MVSAADTRAPIFYDENNTGYYVDPNGTSNLAGLTVANQISGSVSGGSNYVGNTGYGSSTFTWRQDNGTFGPYSGWHNYLISNHGDGSSYYNTIIAMPFWGPPKYSRLEGGSQTAVYSFWTSEGSINSSYDISAPIFYDSNHTVYYVDAASTCSLNSINYAGQVRNSGSGYKSYNLHGMVGDYDQNSTSEKIIWTIGDSWNSIGNMYGLGYTYGAGYGHHLSIKNNGATYHRISFASEGAYFTGTITASGDVVAYSDERTKENIKTIDNALEKVKNLRGVEFNKIGEERKQIGVIAQEIEKVLPEVVKEHDMDGMKTVAYGNIVGVLIEAIKEQQKQIEELKAIVNGITK